LDRLAFVVRAIENDCSVVPVGAFKLTPSHELRYDAGFRGLTPDEAGNWENWQHFREPQSAEKKEVIGSLDFDEEKEDAIFQKGFLDGLQDDKPKGCWSVQSDSSRHEVTVRNLSWPGSIGYHQARSNVFGYAYFGSGLKNFDLPFML
jgi:radial spoke head protein 9